MLPVILYEVVLSAQHAVYMQTAMQGAEVYQLVRALRPAGLSRRHAQ